MNVNLLSQVLMEAFSVGKASLRPPQPSRNSAAFSAVSSPSCPLLATHAEHDDRAGDSSGERYLTFRSPVKHLENTKKNKC